MPWIVLSAYLAAIVTFLLLTLVLNIIKKLLLGKTLSHMWKDFFERKDFYEGK